MTDFLAAANETLVEDLKVYAITFRPKYSELLGPEWQCTLSGFGESTGSMTPTWESSSTQPTHAAAFFVALGFAPAQREAANARAQGRLGDLLPEYDPDGTRFAKPKRTRKASGPKLSMAELDKLLGL